ncbi:hypothetical protein VQ176_004964 [Escherichia coli]|nr:hypothetical protein [Escherichia coli]
MATGRYLSMIPAGGKPLRASDVAASPAAEYASTPLSGESAGHAVVSGAAGPGVSRQGSHREGAVVLCGLMMMRGVVTVLVVKASLSAVRGFFLRAL